MNRILLLLNLINAGNNFPSLIISEDTALKLWDAEEQECREIIYQSIDSRDMLITCFRNIWHNEYLLSLRSTHKNSFNIKASTTLRIGQIVLYKVPSKARPFCSLAEVVELIKSSDNLLRLVKIRCPDGSISTVTVNHIYPLELIMLFLNKDTHAGVANVDADETEAVFHDNSGDESGSAISLVPDIFQRPSKQAAQKLERI